MKTIKDLFKKLIGVATHHYPHTDEIRAATLLEHLAPQELLADQPLKFLYSGHHQPVDGRPVGDWIADGWAPLGIWGSPLDEHAISGEKRDQRQCATSLVAELVGVNPGHRLSDYVRHAVIVDNGLCRDMLDMSRATKIVFRSDISLEAALTWSRQAEELFFNREMGGPSLASLSSARRLLSEHLDDQLKVSPEADRLSAVLKEFPGLTDDWMYRRLINWLKPIKDEDVNPFGVAAAAHLMLMNHGFKTAMEWFNVFVEAHIQSEIRYHNVSPDDWAESGKLQQFRLRSDGKEISVASVVSDTSEITGWVFSNVDPQPKVVIVWRRNGQVQIYRSSHSRNIDLRRVLVALRHEEILRRGLRIAPTHEQLGWDGFLPGLWAFYYPNVNMILNGGETHPEVKPTIISQNSMFNLVRSSLAEPE